MFLNYAKVAKFRQSGHTGNHLLVCPTYSADR